MYQVLEITSNLIFRATRFLQEHQQSIYQMNILVHILSKITFIEDKDFLESSAQLEI